MKQEIQPEPRSEMRHPDLKQEKREIK
jgi:hypothetical protein